METKFVEKSLGDFNVGDDTVLKEADVEKKTPTFDFTEKTWKDDFVLLVEDKRLHVTKAILAHASPVFDAMFQADFKEKNSYELELPGKKAADVQEFLHCIYPNPPSVNFKTVNVILPLAEEYQVSKLKSKCKRCLIKKVSENISPTDLYNVLVQASLYNMPDLLEKCVEVASTMTFDSYQEANKKMKINPEQKIMILERMISHLKGKPLLEVVKEYYEADLKSDQKLDLKDYTEWDGSSLNVRVSLDQWTPFEVSLHDIKAQCSIWIPLIGWGNGKFKIESKTTREEVEKFKFFVKFALIPTSRRHQIVSRKIEFEYVKNAGKEVEISNVNCGSDFVENGFVYYGKMYIKVYILAKKVYNR